MVINLFFDMSEISGRMPGMVHSRSSIIFTDSMNKKITNASFGFAYGICNNFITVWNKEIQPSPGHVQHEPASYGSLGVESVNKFVHE